MEPKFQKSFIPKASLTQSPTRAAKSRAAAMGLVALAGLVLFLATVALSVGVFLYERFLETSIQSKTESLARARAAFAPELLEELDRLDNRITATGQLLSEHVAPSAIFSALEETTLENVQFDSFSYSVLQPGEIDLTLEGEAENFAAVALQSDIFGESRFMRNPIFSNLNVNSEGNVVFSLDASLDPNFILYNTVLNSSPVRNGAFESVDDEEGADASAAQDQSQ